MAKTAQIRLTLRVPHWDRPRQKFAEMTPG
jgi:hypothetical protein